MKFIYQVANLNTNSKAKVLPGLPPCAQLLQTGGGESKASCCSLLPSKGEASAQHSSSFS